MTKKRFLFALTVLLGFLFPVLSIAGEQLEHEGYLYVIKDDGTVQIIGWNGEETSLIIPSEINDLPVTEIGGEAFKNCKIEKIEFPDTICTIGSNAFESCTMSDLSI